MVSALSWMIATITAWLYVHFGTTDLLFMSDSFKREFYRAATALLIMRSVLFFAKSLLW